MHTEFAEYAEFEEEVTRESPSAEAMLEPNTPLGIGAPVYDRQKSFDRQK